MVEKYIPLANNPPVLSGRKKTTDLRKDTAEGQVSSAQHMFSKFFFFLGIQTCT